MPAMARSAGIYGLVLLAVLVLSGCGYRFSPGGENIDQGLKTVYIEPFANKTSEAGVENVFRAAFMDWFVKGSRFKVVDQAQLADVLWQGSVETLTRTSLSYRASNLAAEERMTVILELRFLERESRKVIWADRAFPGNQDYPISDVMNTESARKSALSKLSMDTAERAYRMMMSGF